MVKSVSNLLLYPLIKFFLGDDASAVFLSLLQLGRAYACGARDEYLGARTYRGVYIGTQLLDALLQQVAVRIGDILPRDNGLHATEEWGILVLHLVVGEGLQYGRVERSFLLLELIEALRAQSLTANNGCHLLTQRQKVELRCSLGIVQGVVMLGKDDALLGTTLYQFLALEERTGILKAIAQKCFLNIVILATLCENTALR